MDRLELFLQEKILPDLEKGRPADKPHTLDVVNKLRGIIKNSPKLKLDSHVLVIAAYAHDWGYTDLFRNDHPMTLAELGAQKDTHMLAGTRKLTHLLKDPFFDFLTSRQKRRAVHLVFVHDKLDALKDLDELVLMEADTLAGLNSDILGTFTDSASEERFMRKSRKLRLSRFITDYGKRQFEKLFQKRQEFSRQAKK